MLTADLDPAALAASFHREGIYVLRAAFAKDHLDQLRQRAGALRSRIRAQPTAGTRFWRGGSRNHRSMADVADPGAYSWGLNEVTRPGLFDPVLTDALAAPRVDSVLQTLLDRPRAWGLKMLWASQRTAYRLHWHRDLPAEYGPLLAFKPEANDHVQFNAALEPDDAFIVVPGSHRRATTAVERAAIAADPCGDLPGQVRVALEPGDIVFMDAHALHRGECAVDAPRLSLHYSCQAQWVPLLPWGEPEDFAWHCSEAFRAQLDPATRPYYERLTTAERLDEKHGWLLPVARARGYAGTLAAPIGTSDPDPA